ncbi:MAG: ABC transporter permease subunit [Gemmatimonadetes bacterium]|nr:ABC transporter permease subunit [Gemmatimonadota bacterium]MYB71006.1 ABC transporter permease subunit [Gemmatimonadota bacterium]
MIGIVFKKEMLSHLLSQRFAACTILAVVLIIANGVLTSQTYVHKKASYLKQRAIEDNKLHEVTYYSALGSDWLTSPNDSKPKAAPRALRLPRPLAVFAQGAERQLGQAVKVLLFEVPYQAEEVSPFQSSNPYLAIFAFFDIVYIFQLVLGLLAILIASEAISGEKEDGTLRLMLTTNASRAQVLTGKVFAGLTTLAIPTTLGFILLTILLLGSENIEVGIGEWVRLGLLFALSLLYLLVFYLIGLAISCATHRSATSLIYALFTWALLAIGLPNGISALLNEQANMGEKHAEAHHKAAQVWKAFDREVADLARAHGQTRYFPVDMVKQLPPTRERGTISSFGGTGTYSIRDGQTPSIYLSNVADSPALATFQDIVRIGERLRLKYAQSAWNEKAPLLEGFPRRIHRWNDRLQRLLPAGAYAQAASLLAGTSRREYYAFIDQVRAYRGQIIAFLEERDAFGAREWFNDDEGWRADLRDLPRFQERSWTVAESLYHAWPALTSLLLYAAVLFVFANRLFARYDAM